MAQEIERLQQEEQAASLEKKQRAAALMAEVAAANAKQIQRKRELAEQEKQEEARIAEYIRQKDAREQVGCRGRANKELQNRESSSCSADYITWVVDIVSSASVLMVACAVVY